MTELVTLKQELKARQKADMVIFKAIELELQQLNRRITCATAIDIDTFEKLYPHLYREIMVNPKYRDQILSRQADIPLSLEEFIPEEQKNIRALYNSNQKIINAMDNDKIINYIDLARLLVHMIDSKLSFESTFQIWSMVVGFDLKYIQKHGLTSVDDGWLANLFNDYFDSNGNLLCNDDILNFKGLLAMLLSDYLKSYKYLEEISFIPVGTCEKLERKFNALINAWSHLLEANNARLQMQEKNQDDEDDLKDIKKPVSQFSRESIDTLRKYYKNGELIEAPEDLSAFTDLLNECGLDSKEKRYILSLVQESKRKEVKILKYLSEEEKTIYTKITQLLNEIPQTSGDYYTILQNLGDLTAAGEILDESCEEEKAEMLLEVEIIIDNLREVLGKYTTEEKLSANNILFLVNENEVPFIKCDSDNLDGSFYKMVCSGIRKIRKENQSNFKLVMTSDNMPYRIYDILSSKVHLSFIEIDNGIYVLVGVNTAGQGYDEITKRAINYEEKLKRLEVLVKDNNTRNSILATHEEYISLFNPDAPNVARKRANS